MKQIVVTVADEGRVDVQSTFDLPTTFFLLEKVQQGLLQQDGKAAPAVAPATPAEAELAKLLARRNGHGG